MPLRARPAAAAWRAILGACALAVLVVACDGIITGPDAPETRPRSMRVAPTVLTVASGDTARVTATLFDVTGVPTGPEVGVALTYVSEDTTVARVDATGLVTGVGGGTTTVRGVYGALTLGVPVTVTVRPRLVLVSGGAQGGEQGDTLAAPIVVRALDAAGQPVAGDTVRFVVLSGGGSVTFASVLTDSVGLAETRWVLGLPLGAQSLRAERTASDSVEVVATATPGTSVRRVAVTAGRSTLTGVGDTTQLTAQAFNVVDSLLPTASFVWSSSDTLVATVSPSGLVTSRDTGTVTIVAASAAYRDSVEIAVVSAAPLPKLVLDADRLHPSGLQIPLQLRFPLPPTAGLELTFRSIDPSAVLLALDSESLGRDSVVWLAAGGDSTATYWLQGVEDRVGATASIVVSAPGFAPDTQVITVVAPTAELLVQGSLLLPTAGGGNPSLQLRVGLDSSGTLLPMAMRRGGAGLDVTVAVTDSSVARMRFNAVGVATLGTDQSGTGSVTFTLREQYAETAVPDTMFGVPANLEVERTGVAGSTSWTVTLPAWWQLRPLPADLVVIAPRVALAPDSLAFSGQAGVASTPQQLVAVTNGAALGTLLGLDAEVQYDAGASDWLLVSFDSTTAPAMMTVTALPEFQPVGTWTATVIVTSTTVGAVPDTMRVSLVVGPPPAGLSIAIVDGPLVGVNLPGVLRATLASPAPAGGVAITLVSSDPSRLQVVAPATRSVLEGATTVDFDLQGVALGSAQLTASAAGFPDAMLAVDVTNQILSLPTTLNVPLALTTSIPIQLATPAPAGGVTVALVSSDPTRVAVESATVSIPAGQTLASGTLRGVATGTATITATANGWVSDVTAASTTAQLDILEGGVSLNASFGTPFTVQLRSGGSPLAAPSPGVVVTLTSLDPACAAVPASITIPTGQTNATATVTYGGSASLTCNTRIRATGSGLDPDSLTVSVSPRPSLFGSNATIGSGLQQSTGAGLGASNFGSTTVRIESSNPALVRVAPNTTASGTGTLDIPLTAPSSTFGYTVSAMEGVTGTATLTFSAPGFDSATATVIVRGIGVELLSVPTSTTSFSTNSGFTVRVGALNAAGTAIESELALRIGGTPLLATVASSNVGVARLVTATDSGATVTVTIPVGSSRSPFGIPAGGVELDPVGAGTTTITATSAGLAPLSGGNAAVTVTAPGISASGTSLGAGLQLSTGGSLGASNYGTTTTVHIESSDSSLVLVAPNASTVGTGAIDIPLVTPATGFSYTVSAREGVTGSATLTISAPGFTSTTVPVVVRGLGVELVSVSTTTTALSPNFAFTARVGMLNVAGTAIENENVLRQGGTPLTVTITNSNAGVGQLVTSGGSTQSATATIAVGASRTPFGLASGGVEFDPLAAGSTTLNASIPGIVTLPNAAATVTITAPGISASGGTLGAGLQFSSGGSLGASSYGATTLHIESSDSSLVRVAPNASTVATGAIDIAMTAPTTGFSYTIAAMEGVTGTATLAISAPGFTATSVTVTVRALGIEVISVPTTTTSLSPNSAFTARIGSLNAAGTSIENENVLRTGGTPITVTFANSNPTVGQLVTSGGPGQSATATIAVGASRTPFGLASGGIEFDPLSSGTTTVNAAAPGVAQVANSSASVTVSAPAITSSGGTLGAGLQFGSGASLGASNYGSTTVRVESSDPSRVLVAPTPTTVGAAFIDIPMTAPSTSITYYVSAVEGTTGTATITVSAPGFTSATSGITVRGLGLDLISVPASTTALSANSAFTARIGTLNAAGTAVESELPLRAGGVPIVVTVTNSNASVAQLVTSGGTSQSTQATIPVGQARTPFGVTNGGLEFDPIAAGSTTVTVSAPGTVAVSLATQVVTVTTPTISAGGGNVGAGLHYGTSTSLGATAHGGVTVRIESLDPTRVRVAPDASTIASTFIEVPLVAPQTTVSYQVAGVEGATGTARIAISAAGFRPETVTVTVRPIGVELASLTTSISASAANAAFTVRVGMLNALGTAIESELALRPGGTPIVATVTSSNGAVLQLETQAGTSTSGTVTIPLGATRSPFGVGSGGIAIDPTASGSVTLTVTAPGTTSTPSASVTVTVTP